MKRILLTAAGLLLMMSMLAGCSKLLPELSVDVQFSASVKSPDEEPAKAPVTEAATAPAKAPATEAATLPPAKTTPVEFDDTTAFYMNVVYGPQIERYYTALSQKWDENAYWEHEMSAMAAYYYDGNPMDNVGFTFVDLDGDDTLELIIGAIRNAEKDALVFEIWTLRNNGPAMLAQSGSRNRYYLQHTEEDDLWSVAYEAENGAANHAVYYLQLADSEFRVTQGIVFDAFANEKDPWFMAYDLDWDISNDTPIDEDTANAVMEARRNSYIAAEYIPYSLYK